MNQSSVVPADQQLQKRSKELDAREAYIAAREQIAEETEVAITKGQRDLAMLDATILAREAILTEQGNRLTALEKEYVKKTIVLDAAIAKKQEQYDAWQVKTVTAKQDLQDIKTSIIDRQQYGKEMEILISKQAEDGNLQLRGLEYEIIEAKQVIKDLEVKRTNLYSEQKTLETDLQGARDSFAPELERHEAAIVVVVQRKHDAETEVVVVQTKVHDLSKEVNALLIKRQQIHTDVDQKLQVLDAKEREIMAKREALRVESEEMEEAKHYYKDPKSLYGTI